MDRKRRGDLNIAYELRLFLKAVYGWQAAIPMNVHLYA